MNPTSVSLLDRLRSARPDDPEWLRLEEIYRPLIRRWLGRVPGLGDEASDLTQEVFLVMVREIASFERKREGSFRAWVRQVTVNVLRNHRKRQLRRPAVGLGDYDDFLASPWTASRPPRWPRSWD
jgi:RNA polymerase sigma factor (sigma-70 family)